MAKEAKRGRPGVRLRAALVPLLERLESVGLLRGGPCEVHYRTRSGARWGRYKPRYGPIWWW